MDGYPGAALFNASDLHIQIRTFLLSLLDFLRFLHNWRLNVFTTTLYFKSALILILI